MTELLKELIGYLKTHLRSESLAIVILCLCGIYIWYQHLRNKLLREHIDIEKRKGPEFLATALKLKQSTNGQRNKDTGLTTSHTNSVLLVDDDEMMRIVISDTLRHKYSNIRVETASDGSEALRKIDHEKPSILITDILMPNVDGIELLKTLQEKGIKLPTLVISGYSFPEDFQRLLSKANISSSEQILFLQKPFSMKGLMATLEKLKKDESKAKKL